MPSLSDKLKSLGVKVGTQDLLPPRPRNLYSVEQVLSGHSLETPFGDTFVVESRYPADYRQGKLGLLRCLTPATTASLQVLASGALHRRWAGEPRIQDSALESFAFLDTETTGLSGGTGTYAFLIGLGRFEGEEFHLIQIFMRDPTEEPAQLAAVEEFLAPCQVLVTFNGKTFDVPLLNTRYITHGIRSPLPDLGHIDLLHISRRLWKDRLPSRTLGNLEVQILGASRTQEDVPGWMIPSLFFDYLRDGDARPLKSVFYHNEMDVVSLAALLNHITSLLANPLEGGSEHGSDLIALARLFEDLGDLESATRLYIHSLNHSDVKEERIPLEIVLEAIQRLAAIHKHQDNLPAAVALWEQAARHNHPDVDGVYTVLIRIDSHIELAKFYEHRLRNYSEAIDWTQSAIALLQDHANVLIRRFPPYQRQQWLQELEHRLERLRRKLIP